jgi:hypothetical protein
LSIVWQAVQGVSWILISSVILVQFTIMLLVWHLIAVVTIEAADHSGCWNLVAVLCYHADGPHDSAGPTTVSVAAASG